MNIEKFIKYFKKRLKNKNNINIFLKMKNIFLELKNYNKLNFKNYLYNKEIYDSQKTKLFKNLNKVKNIIYKYNKIKKKIEKQKENNLINVPQFYFILKNLCAFASLILKKKIREKKKFKFYKKCQYLDKYIYNTYKKRIYKIKIINLLLKKKIIDLKKKKSIYKYISRYIFINWWIKRNYVTLKILHNKLSKFLKEYEICSIFDEEGNQISNNTIVKSKKELKELDELYINSRHRIYDQFIRVYRTNYGLDEEWKEEIEMEYTTKSGNNSFIWFIYKRIIYLLKQEHSLVKQSQIAYKSIDWNVINPINNKYYAMLKEDKIKIYNKNILSEFKLKFYYFFEYIIWFIKFIKFNKSNNIFIMNTLFQVVVILIKRYFHLWF